MLCLHHKLKEVKSLSKEWATTKCSDAKQIAASREELDTLMKQLNTNPLSFDSQMKVNKKQEELVKKLKIEEANYKQSSKANWLRLGDSNTKISV